MIIRELGPFLLLLVIAIPCVELPLFAYRTFLGVNRAYPWVSALTRTVAYSPCGVALHMFVGLTMPLGCALLRELWGDGDFSDIHWVYGIPEAVVALTCFTLSFAKRKGKRAKSEAKHSTEPLSPKGDGSS